MHLRRKHKKLSEAQRKKRRMGEYAYKDVYAPVAAAGISKRGTGTAPLK